MKIRLLGSGTSSANAWGACDPTKPRKRRTRASAIVETATTRILIDTSPDMREQLLAADVADVDAVIWTHDHADHCHGIDDLRQIYHARGKPVRGLARAATLAHLTTRFAYVFNGRAGYPPTVAGEALPNTLRIGDLDIQVVDQPHGSIFSAGLRFQSGSKAIGYATDFNILTNDMRKLYHNLDIWVVDALRRFPHPSHPELSEVLQWVEQLQPGRSALIHMDQSMDYATLLGELPPGVEPGYDGLELTA
jgi:phosphoribosyl 1,2-cyclic phosphate phosphodiesterase